MASKDVRTYADGLGRRSQTKQNDRCRKVIHLNGKFLPGVFGVILQPVQMFFQIASYLGRAAILMAFVVAVETDGAASVFRLVRSDNHGVLRREVDISVRVMLPNGAVPAWNQV